MLSGIAAIGIAIASFTAHLARVSQMSRRVRLAWSMGVVIGLAGIAALNSSAEPGEFGSRAEDTPLKSVGTTFIPAASPADFLKRLDALQEELDELSETMAKREARDRQPAAPPAPPPSGSARGG